MKRPFLIGLGIGLLLMFVVGLNVSFGLEQTHNTVPSNNSTFLSDLQNFLAQDEPKRYGDQFTGFVTSGCVISTGAGLTKTPTSCTAYPGGYYATETGSITFVDATANQWVVINKDTTGNLGTFIRVAGTKYMVDATSGALKPALCANCAWMAQVTTAAGAVTVSTDLRSFVPYAQRYLNAELPSAGTKGRMAVVRDQGENIFIDNGTVWSAIFTNPATTKGDLVVFTTTAARMPAGTDGQPLVASSITASGLAYQTLGCVGGGTGLSSTPANGNLLIGNGTCFAASTIQGTSGITVVNSAGGVAVGITTQATVIALGGSSRKSLMSITAATATGTFTADEIVVETALGGTPQIMSNYSQVINLGGTGAGGMDTGTAPASGIISLYAIAQPSGTASIVAANAATINGSIYSGANMPAGYTYSALIGFWPINGSKQMVPGVILDRHFDYRTFPAVLVQATPASFLTVQSVATSASGLVVVPTVARKADVKIILTLCTANNQWAVRIAGDATGTGGHGTDILLNSGGTNLQIGGMAFSCSMIEAPAIPMITAQSIFWADANLHANHNLYVSGYEW